MHVFRRIGSVFTVLSLELSCMLTMPNHTFGRDNSRSGGAAFDARRPTPFSMRYSAVTPSALGAGIEKHVAYREAETGLALPMSTQSSAKVGVQADYKMGEYRFTDLDGHEDLTTRFHVVCAKLIIGAAIGENVTFISSTGARVSGDFKSMPTEVFSPMAAAGFVYRHSDELRFHFGASGTRTDRGASAVPFLGLSWSSISSKMSLFAILPRKMEIMMNVTRDIQLCFETEITSDRWEMEDTSTDAKRLQAMRLVTLRSMIALRLALYNPVWLEFYGGINWFSRLKGIGSDRNTVIADQQKWIPVFGIAVTVRLR